jgi:hypothetical protein
MINKKELEKVYKQDKNLATEIAKVLGMKKSVVVADPENPTDRTFLLLKSENVGQKLTGIKKFLEEAVNILISTAKKEENYDKVDELEKIRDRIILHLNSLKKLSK